MPRLASALAVVLVETPHLLLLHRGYESDQHCYRGFSGQVRAPTGARHLRMPDNRQEPGHRRRLRAQRGAHRLAQSGAEQPGAPSCPTELGRLFSNLLARSRLRCRPPALAPGSAARPVAPWWARAAEFNAAHAVSRSPTATAARAPARAAATALAVPAAATVGTLAAGRHTGTSPAAGTLTSSHCPACTDSPRSQSTRAPRNRACAARLLTV